MTTRYTDPRRVAAFLRCTLHPAGVTLRDEGGRYVIEQPVWQWLQPEVDARQAGIRAVLPTLAAGSVDAVVTDPPYGIKIIRGGGRGISGWRDFGPGGWDTLRPSRECFDAILKVAGVVVVWGGNYFTDFLPPSSQWLIWDKGQRDFSLADCELAWCNQPKAARVFTYPRAAALNENGLHPTQKPLDVMRWCIRLTTRPGDVILDPFMGSGTIGVAAIMEGRRFVGVELDPGYYAIAHKRIANAQPPLFVADEPAQPAPEQAAMFAEQEAQV